VRFFTGAGFGVWISIKMGSRSKRIDHPNLIENWAPPGVPIGTTCPTNSVVHIKGFMVSGAGSQFVADSRQGQVGQAPSDLN
jgi:hypothetical protein